MMKKIKKILESHFVIQPSLRGWDYGKGAAAVMIFLLNDYVIACSETSVQI
ncbi:hypothetical protein [Mucilaginibacter psychrotolerans]|uniref:hypothetical protein n=1 Tax=Mucilaginibacter psychrotolerans TaxID=1524096 RepID=UPI00130518FC|nr:hypothetical protein [Mucilaginibacter psychrotolerans]